MINKNKNFYNKQQYESLLSHQRKHAIETVAPITQSPTVQVPADTNTGNRYFIKWGIVGIILSIIVTILSNTGTIVPESTIVSSICITMIWSISQLFIPNDSLLYNRIQNITWEYWETRSSLQLLSKQQYNLQYSNTNTGGSLRTENGTDRSLLIKNTNQLLQIPIVYVQQHYKDGIINSTDVLQYIKQTYGNDWRKRPMLFKSLWTTSELQSSKTKERRRLSIDGLLQEELIIPYFIDASISNLVTPDGIGSIKDIVSNITTNKNKYHKIGTQLFIKKYPHLINEIIPINLITTLFGNYFTEQHIIQQSSLFGIKLPPLTTVPIFIAGTTSTRTSDNRKTSTNNNNNDNNNDDDNNDNNISSEKQQQQQENKDCTMKMNSTKNKQRSKPMWAHTGLHCEPIGNIAVQLHGEKQWILIQSHYSNLLRPSLSKDGRAFFTSSLSYESIINANINTNNNTTTSIKIPYYTTTISPGDALWVPPWTWHRVDYISSSSEKDTTVTTNNSDTTSSTTSISIGASVFHFRFFDYIINNPLYSILAIPAIVLEVFGYKTQ